MLSQQKFTENLLCLIIEQNIICLEKGYPHLVSAIEEIYKATVPQLTATCLCLPGAGD